MECSCGKGMRKNGFYKSRQRWRCKTCNDNFQEGNLRPRVSESDSIKFQKLASKGTTLTAIAEAFGFSRQCVAYQLKKNDKPLEIPSSAAPLSPNGSSSFAV